MIARDFMTRDIITVSPSTKVKNLAMILIKNQISGAPVVNKNGKILGIVSEADIIAKRGKDAQAIMSKKIISVRQDASLEEIAQLMMTHAIKRLPVWTAARLSESSAVPTSSARSPWASTSQFIHLFMIYSGFSCSPNASQPRALSCFIKAFGLRSTFSILAKYPKNDFEP